MSPDHRNPEPGVPPAPSDRDASRRHAGTVTPADAQARLAAIVTGSEDAIVAKQLDGIVTAWNPAAERLFGYAADEMIGRSILTIIPPELHDEEPISLGRIARGERIAHFETVRVRKNGSRFPAALTVSPIRDGDGGVVGASKILRDITDRKALEAEREHHLEQLREQTIELEAANEQLHAQGIELELQNQELTSAAEALEEAVLAADELRAEAERANDAKGRFLATMSHELRTPINAIVGYAQLLELGVPDPATPSQQRQLGRISASAQHLLALVNDVLDGAKLDFGEMHVASESATTNSAISAALMVVSPQAHQQRIRLVDGREDDADVAYVGDDARVRQILINLLSNAIKFTPAGGTVTVTSGAAAEAPASSRAAGIGPWAYVRVTDTGVGIAAAQHGVVFEPFVQVAYGERLYTRSTGGTGLGLTISRRLARLMGGDLTLESEPGAGSAFTLWLPATSMARTPANAAREHLRTSDAPTPSSAGSAPLLTGRWPVQALADVGRILREEGEAVLARFTEAMRSDPTTPGAQAMAQSQLEDHVITLISDLAQSLVIIADAGDDAPGMMRDSTAILRTIAETHGARRFEQGWTEAALRREHQILRDTIAAIVRERLDSRADQLSDALSVLARITERTQLLGVAAFRYAAAHAASGDSPHGARGDRTE